MSANDSGGVPSERVPLTDAELDSFDELKRKAETALFGGNSVSYSVFMSAYRTGLSLAGPALVAEARVARAWRKEAEAVLGAALDMTAEGWSHVSEEVIENRDVGARMKTLGSAVRALLTSVARAAESGPPKSVLPRGE